MTGKQNVAYEPAVIISIISVLMVGTPATSEGSKIDILEQKIKADGLLTPKLRHYLKVVRGAYKDWHRRVFWSEEPDAGEAVKLCEDIARGLSKEFTAFASSIERYLRDEDCVYTEPIAYNCAICSLLRLATGYCDVCAEQYTEFSAHRKRLDTIAPRQLFRNILHIYEGLYLPTDLDVSEQPKVLEKMNEMGEKIYLAYIRNFTVQDKKAA